MSGLLEVIKSPAGRLFSVEGLVGLIGAVLNFFKLSFFDGFLFWTTLIVSIGIVLLTYFKILEVMKAKFPFLERAIFFYLGLYTILYLIMGIFSFFPFGINSICLTILFIIYGFHSYTIYRSLGTEAPVSLNWRIPNLLLHQNIKYLSNWIYLCVFVFLSDENSHLTLKKGASSIVSKIRPLWDNHEYKIFNDGLTNKLIGVYPKGTSLSEMIIVRVYGEETDKLIDRKSELKFINILHSLDLSAPVYAIYGNGFAYGYSPGVTLNMDSVKDPNIYPLLAKKLSLFHKINLNPECTRQSKIWFKMREMVKFIRNSSHFHGLDKEVELCYEYFTGLNDKYKKIAQLNKVVLCHNDLLLGNIIYDESLKNVSLIDFEYLFDNYQWYDIANHFCEFVGLSTSLDFENCIPKEDFQKKMDFTLHGEHGYASIQ
ncbi:ETNK [Lepeophtheirus salmonis]|uniref:ethanolamine kinase n=1 Tax=Lepeophtheirus salmonis TaxID=72036 RepID=A0A7R8CVZ9_LEPSM|nr:ETNK [Lepeophtheirus salmonis]CAF2949118.1 ETNK [Lepeophtheirus salmonis]